MRSQKPPVRYPLPKLPRSQGEADSRIPVIREVVLGMGDFLQYTVIGLTVGSFYALVALGYTIVYGIIRLINFAQGDLSMIGAFLGWTLVVGYGVHFLPLFPALVVAFAVPMLGTAVVNLAILEVAYKPLLNRSLLAIL